MKVAGHTYAALDGGWDLLDRKCPRETAAGPGQVSDAINPVRNIPVSSRRSSGR